MCGIPNPLHGSIFTNKLDKTWHHLGLRLGPTVKLYHHDESSVSFNYRLEHADLELPAPVSMDSLTPELENVRFHLNFSIRAQAFPNNAKGHRPQKRPLERGEKQKRGGSVHASGHGVASYLGGPRLIVSFTKSDTHGFIARRESPVARSPGFEMPTAHHGEKIQDVVVKREELSCNISNYGLITHEYQDQTMEMGIFMVSDHHDLETVVYDALNHILLGSRPRGSRIFESLVETALTKVAPSIFDTNRLRVLLPSPPPIDILLMRLRVLGQGCP